MAPKIKVTREDIVNTAIDIVRVGGTQAINARTVASVLNCSTQPVFSNFASMEDLRFAVVERANSIYEEYIKREIESGEYPAYKASGVAYIRFAKDETELFKLLFMRDRSSESDFESIEFGDKLESFVQDYTGLGATDARMFHLEMWAYVHGLASMVATGFVDLEWELISRMLTDAYFGLRKQYGME